ncbi:MAG: RpoL/Rpb11 RNA polymerase subunit family protein [Candidatus Aenigmatarchaeota archaeon]
MNLRIIEENKDRLELEIEGEPHTLTQLLATQAWKERGEAASIKEHPFMKEPKIVVMGRGPRKILERSAKSIQRQCDEFKEEFIRALKK